MTFYMPVKVYDEKNCVLNHAGEIAAFGTKALLVTGRSSAKKSGALDDVQNALSRFETSYCLFDEIEENPSVETIWKAYEYAKKEDVDFVIGIGGGSPLDASKAIAFLLDRKDASKEDLYNADLPADALPVIAIPTTCGTGSEVTGVSVLTVHEKKTKVSIPHKIFPKIALVDGKYLKSAPKSMIVSTAIDALAHMIESFESNKADNYSKAAVLEGLKIWGRSKDTLLNGLNEECFGDMMRASTFAGIAIAQTGTSIPHALSYILTYEDKIPHGMACGYFLKGYLQNADPSDRKQILDAAGFQSMEEFSAYMDQIFLDMHVKEETLQRAYEVVSQNKARLKGCRFFVDEEVLKKMVF